MGLVLTWCISVKIMVISERQNIIYFQPFLKIRKFLIDMTKDFLIMSNYYLVEILSEPNSLTTVTSKKLLKVSNYVLILSCFFLKMRIRNLQCIQDRHFRDCSQIGCGGRQKHWKRWNLAELYLTLEKSKKYIDHVTCLLSSADIDIFPPKIVFLYQKCKYRLRLNF